MRQIYSYVFITSCFFLEVEALLLCYSSEPWQPEWSQENRNDLRCSTTCQKLVPRDDCCTCKSCMSWEGSEKELSIEYTSVLGRSIVIPNQVSNNSDVYKVEHKFSDITEIPSNICNWDNETNLVEHYVDNFQNMSEFWEKLVELNLVGNKIRKIPDINCLIRLDKLYLDDNNIESLSNTSFANLTRLRVLSLERNRMKNIDPSVISSPQLNLFFANLGYNDLQKLDVTNMMSLRPFCSIDYENNEIDEIVNDNDFKLEMDKTYGPGFVYTKNNKIETFPNFKDLLHLKSWAQMGKLISFGFDFMGIPLICDCNLEPFMTLADGIKVALWRDYMNVTCTGPDRFAGKRVMDVPTEEFTCPIKQDKGCQSPECTCEDKPKEDTLYINCSNLHELPTIPVSNHSKYVSLNVSGNHITQIANMPYLSRLISLDISRNDLLDISESTAKQLENCTNIDISDNPKIRSLPQTFQYRNVCTTYMRNLNIECNCDTSWIETWLDSNVCENNDLFNCDIPNSGKKRATEFHTSKLECFFHYTVYILLSVTTAATLILITVSAALYMFRYEILIIYLRLRNKNRNAVHPYKFDVYISFNEDEEHVVRWVIQSLEPRLHDSGYATFLALKHISYGSERNAEVITAINNSRNFLIILSESYLQLADEGMRSWTENEWKFGWHNFKQDRNKNILLVNYDHMEPSDINHPIIRAYLRVGCTVDFKNHNRDIMDDVEVKLGKPNRVDYIDTKVNENQNKKLPRGYLFTASQYLESISVGDLDFEKSLKSNEVRNPTQKTRIGKKPCVHRKCYACKQKELTRSK